MFSPYESEVNTSTTPLDDGETYTGTWEKNDFPDVMVSCKTDAVCTLYFDFSKDGVNVDTFPTAGFQVASGTHEFHPALKGPRYFRVRLVNASGANATYLRLYTYFGQFRQPNAPANAVIQQDADAIVTRPLDFNLNVAQLKYAGHQTIFKDGDNPDIRSGTVPEDVWDNGGTYTGFPISAAAAEVVSTNAGDTGTLFYAYLESPTSESYVTASVTLNGTTPVALGHNVWRCNFMFYDTGDDTTFNLGTISLYHTATPANIFCTIRAGFSQSFCAAYTVPYGSKAYIDRITANIRGSASAAADGFLWWRPIGLSPRLRQAFNVSFGSLYFDDIDYLFTIPAQTDFIPRITACSSASATEIQASYRLVLVKD